MTDAERPYGELSVLKSYCSNINLGDDTFNFLLARAANKVEGYFKTGGKPFQTDFELLDQVKDYVETRSACKAHMMYGDRNDAKIYCDDAKEILADMGIIDTSLETDEENSLYPAIEETYPSNPVGRRLEGRSHYINDNRTVPPWG